MMKGIRPTLLFVLFASSQAAWCFMGPLMVHKKFLTTTRASNSHQEDGRRFMVSPSLPNEGVATFLERAGVPSEEAREAARGLEGLLGASVDGINLDMEAGGRLRQLNFLMQEGIYTWETAVELLALQPGFLRVPFSVAYEDEGLFVLNKPFDVRMDVPKGGERKWEGEVTCSDWVTQQQGAMDRMRFIHNLDSATSGVLVVAKDRQTAAECVSLFQSRRVKKQYLAVVEGHVSWEEQVVDAPIGEAEEGGFCMVVGGKGAKDATTKMTVLQRGYLGVRGPRHGMAVTKLRLEPVTGRKHQLRVHLKHCGHPMIGDAAYANDWYTHRLHLHAHRLHLPLARKPDLWIETPDPFDGPGTITLTPP